MATPKLRKASVVKPLYPLNQFPASFAENVAKQIYVIKATSLFATKEIDITGSLWEHIFAASLNVDRESAIALGLDDIQDSSTSTAWGAKTVKWTVKKDIEDQIANGNAKVQLISGRNSPDYSYGVSIDCKVDDPAYVGGLILDIWNARVKEVRTKYSNLRSAVLVKCDALDKVAVFEKEISLYDAKDYVWEWNKNYNLKGALDGEDKFTWQPHGSQFTINNVYIPQDALLINIGAPSKLSEEAILKHSGWDKNKFKAYKTQS